jgi:cellulose synthase/poly-beta-1,6-N-acetylglucosamine synthase-like glycosyltransferase
MRVRRVLAPPTTVRPDRTSSPSFSVTIAAYQAAGFVAEAVESALGQSYVPLEVIVCDDGSTDDLAGALAPYRNRISLLRKENGGEASAKNAAARAARGDFIAILDADDVYDPSRLEAVAEAIQARPDLDIVTTDCRIVVDGRFVRTCYVGDYRFETGDQRAGILERNFLGPGHMAVRREALLRQGGFDESFRHATDWDCWIRMILSGSRAGLVDEPLAEYRVRATSLASDRLRQFDGYVAVLQKAAARDDLLPHEHTTVEQSLARQKRRRRMREAEIALADSRPDARRLAFELALERGFPVRERLLSATAAVLPGLARRRLRRAGPELAGGTHG